MDFVIGFAAGSGITFIVLAIYGFKGMMEQSNEMESILQVREEQMYQAGYVNGFKDGQEQSTTIDNLSIIKN